MLVVRGIFLVMRLAEESPANVSLVPPRSPAPGPQSALRNPGRFVLSAGDMFAWSRTKHSWLPDIHLGMGKEARRQRRDEKRSRRKLVETGHRVFLSRLEQELGSPAPYAGAAAERALEVAVALMEDDLRDFVSNFDYGQMAYLSLCAGDDSEDFGDLAAAGLNLLRLVHATATDGTSTLDDRDHSQLLEMVMNLEEQTQLLEFVRAGLLEFSYYDGRRRELTGSFDVEGWYSSVFAELPVVLGIASKEDVFADPMNAALAEMTNGRSAHTPGVFADIDAAMREDLNFGVPELILALHLIWSSTYTSPKGKGPSFLFYRGHIVEILRGARREYPWLTERADLDGLVDFLTVPFGRDTGGRGFRHGYGWLRPFIELPQRYVPNGFECQIAQPTFRGDQFGWVAFDERARFAISVANQHQLDDDAAARKNNTFILTSDSALRASLSMWHEVLLDGEWPFDKASAPTVVSAIRKRRQRQRPIDEFETEVPAALAKLGMATWTNLQPSADGSGNPLGLVLRNEIDVVAVDAEREVIWVVEVKDLTRCWTGQACATRIAKYVNEFVPKLEQKRDDLKAGLPHLVDIIGGQPDQWSVQTCFITRYRDPAHFDTRVRHPVIPVGWCHLLLGVDARPTWAHDAQRSP